MGLSLIPSTVMCLILCVLSLYFSGSVQGLTPESAVHLVQLLRLVAALSGAGVVGNLFCLFEIRLAARERD